jgi:hypothetical protein
MRKANVIKTAAWAAALFVAGSVVAAAIRAGSWDPVYTVGWLVPVMIAVTSADRPGRCLPRRGRGRQPGESRPAG